MDGVSLFPLFVVGLLGSVHCAGMCGGIVGALSAAPAARRSEEQAPMRWLAPAAVAQAAPGRPAAAGAGPAGFVLPPSVLDVLAYNLGRLSSYALAGALAGAAGAGARALAPLPALQAGAYWLANLMLVALGLYLMDAWRGLAHVERGGQLVWRHVRPLLRRLGPLDGPRRMLAAGALWGWLPCGMVYSVLVTAMLSGSAHAGALAMLAFGAGTLPMLLALGLAGARLRALRRRPGVRRACGLLVLAFGLLGLARAAGGLPHDWTQDLCVARAPLPDRGGAA